MSCHKKMFGKFGVLNNNTISYWNIFYFGTKLDLINITTNWFIILNIRLKWQLCKISQIGRWSLVFVKGHVQYVYYYLRFFFIFFPPKYAYCHNKH